MSLASLGQKVGEEWTSRIYFDPEADQSSGSEYGIGDEDLIREMRELVKGDEDIVKVIAYRCPLFDFQLSQELVNHQFIVFRTKAWWWSIEKDSQGITIQRSKEIKYVRDRYRRVKRLTPVEIMDQDSGRRSMEDLINYLYGEDELNKPYNLYTDNCQHFAKRIFDEIAKAKCL